MSKHVDAFCSPSQFSANMHKQFGFGTDMRVTPSFLSDKSVGVESASHSRPFFLFVGRLEHIKGVQDVIPAFKKDASADLLIVGSGNYENELKELAGDSKHIHFLGWKKPEEIKTLYQQAVAALMPSICYEVFPLVLLEALREGTPVIARSLGPYPELVKKSGAGFLFETVDELEHAIESLATDQTLRDSMSQAGLDAYETYWSETRAMKDYFKLIHSIAEKRGMNVLAEATA